MEILFYADGRGHQPVYEWLESIKTREPATFRKVTQILIMLEENGEYIRSGKSNRKDIKRLKGTDDIWQIRIGSNRILYFYYSSDALILTNQFKKKSNQTPKSEITRAETRKTEWINRKQI